MIEDELRSLLREIDWEHVVDLADTPELRGQIEALIEQLAAYEDWRSLPEP